MEIENEAAETVETVAEEVAEIIEEAAEEAVETIEEAAEEIVEEGGVSDEVKIAEIAAEREIAVESIRADVEIQRIEAIEAREETSWEKEAAELRANLMELTTQVGVLLSALPSRPLTPPELPELEPDPEAVTIETAAISIPASTLEEINEMPTEASLESEEERPAERAPGRKRRRPI
jgi:hypothetical protein